MAWNREYSKASTGYMKNNNSYQSRNSTPKKRSGCKWHAQTKNGSMAISGWKYSKAYGGIMSFLVAPYYGTKSIESETGKVWENWICKCTYPSGETKIFNSLVNMDSHKFYVKDQNWMGNPNANNGGYFGKHISKNYDRR